MTDEKTAMWVGSAACIGAILSMVVFKEPLFAVTLLAIAVGILSHKLMR